jgi:hypothetical protein
MEGMGCVVRVVTAEDTDAMQVVRFFGAFGSAVLLSSQMHDGIRVILVAMHNRKAAGLAYDAWVYCRSSERGMMGSVVITNLAMDKGVPLEKLALYEWFSRHGAILSVVVKSAWARPMAYVNFADMRHAVAAVTAYAASKRFPGWTVAMQTRCDIA